jgi:hypothetical protein
VDDDNALRQYFEAEREARTQKINDQRSAEGLAPMHCRTEAALNRHGDYECRRCGAIFA